MHVTKSHALAFAAVLALAACSGSTGSPGSPGAAGQDGTDGSNGTSGSNGTNGTNGQDLTATAKPESCAVCHPAVGGEHQALYNSFNDGLGAASKFTATIDSVVSVPEAGTNPVTYTSTMTFTLKKGGVPYVDGISGLKQKTYNATEYDTATKTFTTATAFNYGTPTATATPGQYTVVKTGAKFAPEASSGAMVYAYFGDALVLPAAGHYNLMDNMVSVAKVYGAIDYVSTANVSACENCHGKPYSKHGYRQAVVAGLPDFAACKACHTDQRPGSDAGWYLLVDDPYTAATVASPDVSKYAYTANVMNDTHNSHAFEFAYPQSMSNCVTCHAGKLDKVLTDANFKLSTCKSCHAVNGPEAKYVDAKRAPALKTLMTADSLGLIHTMDLYTYTGACNVCHTTGGVAKTFSQIHSGYNSKVYAAGGAKYSDTIKVTIDTTTVTNNVLDIKFSATGSAGGLNATSIVPTVLISLYGYDTKDFLVSAHNSDIDGSRNLEAVVGSTHPRIKTVSAANGAWEVTADLSAWASKITDGSIKRAEIAIVPTLKNAAGEIVALNAPSKTFDLKKNAFDVTYFTKIVDEAKCNKCHEALGTSFHSPDRGGNVVVCRVCHTTNNGASHYEMQSRSIDSYVHAIHSMEYPDAKNLDFADPVVKMRYNEHIEGTYPNFTTLNCESCHNPGTYDVPDQSKSMPGLLSASSVMKNWDRNIGTVPGYVTGPASRACGGCHRAAAINEDKAGELASFNEHTAANGTLLPVTTVAKDAAVVLNNAILKIMAVFK